MNLRWNGTLRRFEAEFSGDFQGDLAAVKAAGFKTDGAPGWVWHTHKATPLTKLRENRPASGLTITPEAREQYVPLAALEAKNAEIKAEAAKADKALKKTLKAVKQEGNAIVFPEKGYIDASDLPPVVSSIEIYTPPLPPDLKCFICGTPVYFYELQDPPTCLWCEKIALDKNDSVC